MLSALLATNAMPRRIHIVPSVMMNGWTREPDDEQPVEHAAEQADADGYAEAEQRRSRPPTPAPCARSTIAMVTPASA